VALILALVHLQLALKKIERKEQKVRKEVRKQRKKGKKEGWKKGINERRKRKIEGKESEEEVKKKAHSTDGN
jgi:hypothetical protein